jgi:hypothetical protein
VGLGINFSVPFDALVLNAQVQANTRVVSLGGAFYVVA